MKQTIGRFFSPTNLILTIILAFFTFSTAKAEYYVVNAGPNGGCCCSYVCNKTYKKVHKVKHYHRVKTCSYTDSRCYTTQSPYEVADYAWLELGG